MTERPKVKERFDALLASFDAACGADARLPVLIGRAQNAETPEDRTELIVAAALLLAEHTDYPAVDWAAILAGNWRVGEIPGVPGRIVWAILNDADVDALRAVIEPGQVWIRSDLVKSDEWPTVRATAMDAAERTIGKVREPGRRKGSRVKLRAELIGRVRATPELADEDIDRMAVETGLWEDRAGDYDTVRKRVARLRKDAAPDI